MPRRGGGRHSEIRHNQPSPVPSQQTSSNAEGSGRGGGSRGGHTVQYSSPAYPPPPSSTPATFAPSVATPVASTSSSPSLSSPATVSSERLSSEVEQKLTLQTASVPSSVKALRFPNRPGFGRLGRKIQVRANHFQLQVADKDLHHYDVSISPEIASKKVSRDVMNQLVKMHQATMLGNLIPAYDGRKSLFTAGPLPFTSKVFVVNLVDGNGGSSSGSTKKKREREFKVTIQFASKTDMFGLNQFLSRLQLDCPYETIQALDVALRVTSSEMYTVAGRSFFSPSFGAPGPLGGGTEFYRGYYQSIRPTQMGLSLNIGFASTYYLYFSY